MEISRTSRRTLLAALVSWQAAAGFESVIVHPCPPVPHGLISIARVTVWKAFSAFCKLALAAETGMIRGHIVTQNITFVAFKAK